MLQIRIQGRGGQGAQIAGQMLATAFFRENKYVQAFASYGGARRGTPVNSYLRVDDNPIVLRCDIEEPDAILCFDASLLSQELLESATDKTIILVNTAIELDREILRKYRVTVLDAIAIARKHDLGRIVNTTLLGAFAALLGEPALNNLLDVINEMSPVRIDDNVNSCLEAYHRIASIKE